MKILRAILLLTVLTPTCFGAGTGRTKLTFANRSPDSTPEEMLRRWREAPLDHVPGNPWQTTRPAEPDKFVKQNWEYDLANESFDVFVPPNYKQDTPHGLLVWTGVTDFSKEWFDVLARRKLIFVTPIKRENHVPSGLYLDAAHNMKKNYAVDEKRIYTCGFSDGARMAASMVVAYPETFRGGLFLNGDNFYDVNIQQEPTLLGRGSRWHGPLNEIRKDTRLVLMRGERDSFTPKEGRDQYDSLVLDGFERVSFFVVPNKGHEHPNATWFEKGIDALDNPKRLKPPTTAPTTQPNPSPGQIAQAKRILATGKLWIVTSRPNTPGAQKARRYLQQVIDEYPTTPSAKIARELMEKSTRPATQPLKR